MAVHDHTIEHDCDCAPGANDDFCKNEHAWDCWNCDAWGKVTDRHGCGCCVSEIDCPECDGTGIETEWRDTFEHLEDQRMFAATSWS